MPCHLLNKNIIVYLEGPAAGWAGSSSSELP